ncbi:MAG: PAS domain-containing protein [Henriciella sp.]
MNSESTGFQGLTQAHAELISYWRDQHIVGVPPAREDLDPGAIRAHLSALSIVEIGRDGRARFRLVGSSLRQIFGRDMGGRLLTELSRDVQDTWSLGIASVLDQRRPIGGLIRGDVESHAWLRLPLQSGANGAMVLCHDCLIPNQRLQQTFSGESRRQQVLPSNIAA